MIKLLEADIMTVNIPALFKAQKEQAEGDTQEASMETDAVSDPADAADLENVTDWGEVLKKRLARNAKRSEDARIPESEVRDKFWKDFFRKTPGWNKTAKNNLFKMALFRADMEQLGFVKTKNPIYAFVSSEYVQEELIATGLLNDNTYQVIHNIVAKKLLPYSEFAATKNDYNIIYCRDLYRKPVSDMMTYLTKQASILTKNVAYYDEERQELNIRTFLKIGNTSVLAPEAKLNNLSSVDKTMASAGIKATTGKEDSETSSKRSTSPSRADLVAVVKKLLELDKSGSFLFAGLQFVGMKTGSSEVNKALAELVNNKKVQVSVESIVAASNKIASIKELAEISADEVSDFVDLVKTELE